MQLRQDGSDPHESSFCVQRPILPGTTSQLSPTLAHLATGLWRVPLLPPELAGGQPARASMTATRSATRSPRT
jgi:hypothetical protein